MVGTPGTTADTDAAAPSRRDVLRAAAGGAGLLGIGKAIDNVLIGYGVLTGTNLRAQAASGELADLAREGFRPARHREQTVGDYTVRTGPGGVDLLDEAGPVGSVPRGDTARAVELDARFELPGVLEELAADLDALAAGDHQFAFYGFEGFFDRLEAADPRPWTVGAVRRWRAAQPDLVESFAKADPAAPQTLLEALVEAFRDRTYYDIPRYAAGSVQDNLIAGAVDLRALFRNPVDFGSLSGDGTSGLFCYEFAHRSIEALHAVPAADQSVPVVGARVWDQRHKHVYTAVASLVRDGGDLEVPVTFVDYTHSTLNDDLRLRGALGEGFEAYDRRHRASLVHWRR